VANQYSEAKDLLFGLFETGVAEKCKTELSDAQRGRPDYLLNRFLFGQKLPVLSTQLTAALCEARTFGIKIWAQTLSLAQEVSFEQWHTANPVTGRVYKSNF
jgi:hypothetical protein